MTLTPEAQIIVINAVLLLAAYGVIYPLITGITIMQMVWIDLALSVISLGIAGYLYWGTGTEFTLFLFSVNWVFFTLLTLFVMEMPLFHWFCKSRGLKPFQDDGDI